ncbi:PTS sugar transporter subunit IIA [Candidatus Latescibacterota bacterium]
MSLRGFLLRPGNPAIKRWLVIIMINTLISVDRIKIIDSKSKEEAIKELAGLLGSSENITDCHEIEKGILDREQIMSTAIGLGIAIPHVRHEKVKEMTIAIGVCKEGIEYHAIDEKPVVLMVMIVSPLHTHREYLKVLAKLVLILKNDELRNTIINANSPEEIYSALKER